MTMLSKRGFLRRSAGVAGAVALGGLAGIEGLSARDALAANGKRYSQTKASLGEGGYGPLQATPDLSDGAARLALPEGFSYRSFGQAGTLMADGFLTPLAHVGMGAFPLRNGNIRLIRNHEDRNGPGQGSLAGDGNMKYDTHAGGGTTSLEVEPRTRQLIRDYISLNGTTVNCAGGPTPWGSWLTCEETIAGPSSGWSKPHGAVAIDPDSGIVYETEDRCASGFYRFIPDHPGFLAAGGRLQMLAIKRKPNYDTSKGQRMGKPLPVTWVDIQDPDPVFAETNDLAVFEQGAADGGAVFSRLEGCWYGNGSIFFNATSGGDAGLGQVWEYRPRGNSGGQLILVFESRSPEVLESPDNICVTPRGGLVLCEDGDGEQFLRGLTPRGLIFDFALNRMNDYEWAGATFSPDGETLFVNIQGATNGANPPAAGNEGMTFAIWGPWRRGAL